MRLRHLLLAAAAVGGGSRPTGGAPRFVVYSRIFHDAPFVEFFVEWYFELGFDKVVLLDTYGHRALNVSRPDKLLVERVRNRDDDVLRHYAHLAYGIRGAEWVLLVDLDEFLVLDKQSIAEFVDGVEARHGRTDVLQFRWLVINHMAPWCSSQPFARFVTTSRPIITEVIKSMGRVASTTVWNTHRPRVRHQAQTYRIVADGTASTMTGREFKQTVHRLPLSVRPSFDSAIVHVEVRSLADHFTKALNSRISDRPVPCPPPHTPIAALVNRSRAMEHRELLLSTIKLVGVKAINPLVQERVVGPSFQCEHGLTDTDVRIELAVLLAKGPPGPAHRSLPFCIAEEEEREFSAQLAALGVARTTWDGFAAALGKAHAAHAAFFVDSHRRVCASLVPCDGCAADKSTWRLSNSTDCYAHLSRCLLPEAGDRS